MKKLLLIAFATLLVGSLTLSAQTPQKPAPPQAGKNTAAPNFIDANGDGICDNFQAGTGQGRMGAGRRGNGPGDGTGNRGVGPRDGTGYGRGQMANGGICDGTGPKGPGRGRGPRR